MRQTLHHRHGDDFVAALLLYLRVAVELSMEAIS